MTLPSFGQSEGTLHPYFPNVDPERKWLFRLEFGSVPGSNDVEILAINARAVTAASLTNTPLITPHLNQDVKSAGRPEQGDMTVTFQTAYNKDAVTALEKWYERVYNPVTEQMGYAEDYKVDGKLIVFDTAMKPVKIYQLKGIFPTNLGDIDYAWDATEATTRSVIFSVDKILPPHLVK